MAPNSRKAITLIAIVLALVVIKFVYSKYFPFPHREQDTLVPSSGREVIKISSRDADPILSDPATFVLDVHLPEQPHLPETDAFIPYNELAANLTQLPEDKTTPILVYCRSGSMSDQATRELVQMGYTKVYDLVGGLNAYRESHVQVLFSPATIALGKVVYGEVATAEFKLTNFTPQPLTITRVSTSCKCTSAEVETAQLEPYVSTSVYVSFDPAVHKDDTDLGELTRTIYLDTDNLNFPQVTATITANVVKK